MGIWACIGTLINTRGARTACVLAPIALVALIATGCATTESQTATAAESGPPQHGGKIIFGLDQEPQCLNTVLTCGSMAVARMVSNTMLQSWVSVTPDGVFLPSLAAKVPTAENGLVREVGKGMEVEVPINRRAKWSDGVPITCTDMKFGWELRNNKDFMIGSRVGWDKISDVKCPDPKTAILVFSVPYAAYIERILKEPAFPAHVLKGKDFNKFWNDRLTVSSGPFVFERWVRNIAITVKRNPNYWKAGDEQLPYLDTIEFRFIRDTNTLKIQLRTGEVDFIQPPPDTNLVYELNEFPRAKNVTKAGIYWEQIAFNTAEWPLDDKDVRKALAHSIDRTKITDVVLRKQVSPLQSTLLPDIKQYYLPEWKQYDFNRKTVARHLTKAGFKKDGKWWKKGGKELTVTFKSTAGNALRMKVAQLLQQDFASNGINMKIVLEDAGVLFSQSLPTGTFGLGLWAWSSTVDPTQTTLFACDQIPLKKNKFSGSNNYRYCNTDVTRMLKEADGILIEKDRIPLVHAVQEQIADDAILVPLYQRPETVAYSRRMHNVVNNPLSYQTQDVDQWWVNQ